MKARWLAGGTAALLATLAVPGRAEPVPPADDAVAAYARLAAPPGDARCAGGESLTLLVEPEAGAAPSATLDGQGRLHLLYRMAFNQVTEGWNWHPEADPGREDYYRYKYLPLKSVAEERGRYRAEDKLGEPQDMRVAWRYDYFLAFDNLYDFFPRQADDDAGFAADLPVPAGGPPARLRLTARVRLAPPCMAESTTFWKATYAKPVDLTLKKRYLIGTLQDVWFVDGADGRVLAHLAAPSPSARVR